MEFKEFLELLYYHIIYSLDTGFISILLIVVVFELFRINDKLDIIKGGISSAQNKTEERKPDPEHDDKTDRKILRQAASEYSRNRQFCSEQKDQKSRKGGSNFRGN